jgi:hypothetical protein
MHLENEPRLEAHAHTSTPEHVAKTLILIQTTLELQLTPNIGGIGKPASGGRKDKIKRISGQGGKRALFFADSGGLFCFEEHTSVTEDDDTYWSPTSVSGLYGSAEDAERDARMELPWLREPDSK